MLPGIKAHTNHNKKHSNIAPMQSHSTTSKNTPSHTHKKNDKTYKTTWHVEEIKNGQGALLPWPTPLHNYWKCSPQK